MTENIYPLMFIPVYKEYLWGGDRIGHYFKRNTCPAICAESWEISDHPDGMSVISNGMLSGATLRQIIEKMPDGILGPGKPHDAFPLLVKIIDASQRLSVQVHPGDRTSESLNAQAKTEMWYILDAKPGAKIFAGWKDKTTRRDFVKSLQNNTVDKLLNSIPVSKGDSIYIPGGTIHSIGEGCLILEIQQNSNTTYRVYDWNRTDRNGLKRELHIPEAMEAIDWENNNFKFVPAGIRTPGHYIKNIISCPFFTVTMIDLQKKELLKNPCHTFSIVFSARGSLMIATDSLTQHLNAGNACLLPAAIKEYSLIPANGAATVIHISQPSIAR